MTDSTDAAPDAVPDAAADAALEPEEVKRPPERHRGPVVLRRGQVLPSTTDQRLLDSRGPADWVHTDPWRVLRIQSEFVEGFGVLAELPRAVSVFGSARTKRDDPEYAVGMRLGAALAEAGFAVITGGGPGTMEAVNRGAQQAGGTSVGLGIELPFEQRLNDWVDLGVELPLLLRPQDDVRQVRPGFRHPARRVRHPRRAVRGAHAGADRQGDQVPGDPARYGVLAGAARLAASECAAPGQDQPGRTSTC